MRLGDHRDPTSRLIAPGEQPPWEEVFRPHSRLGRGCCFRARAGDLSEAEMSSQTSRFRYQGSAGPACGFWARRGHSAGEGAGKLPCALGKAGSCTKPVCLASPFSPPRSPKGWSPDVISSKEAKGPHKASWNSGPLFVAHWAVLPGVLAPHCTASHHFRLLYRYIRCQKEVGKSFERHKLKKQDADAW